MNCADFVPSTAGCGRRSLLAVALVLLTAGHHTALGQDDRPADAATSDAEAAGDTAAALGPAELFDADALPWFQELPLPAAEGRPAPWCDFVLTPEVFDGARLDLGDLRLVDAAGREVPYVLRVLRPQFTDALLSAAQFNQGAGPEGGTQVTLDLGESPPEHNELEIDTPGIDFRRRVELEGSDDAQSWLALHEGYLFHFRLGERELRNERVLYPPSRFRYLRVRVYRDSVVDEGRVEILAAQVHYRVERPGEFVAREVTLGPREPTRVYGSPGSAWIIDLGFGRQPVSELLLTVDDAQFARDWVVEAGAGETLDERLFRVGSGQWERRAGEPREPVEASLDEHAVNRLRLMVTDFRNPPLKITSATVRAPVRQVIFRRTRDLAGPLRLYYGNPEAELPHYDLERTLPAELEPAPVRLELGARRENPDFVPRPLPITERWPWLIYAVLGSACAALGAVLANLGRAALRAGPT